jgi:Na+/proline symporter
VLLLVFFAAGVMVALIGAILTSRTRVRMVLAGLGVLLWVTYAIYIEKIYSCPRSGECDKELGIFLLAFTLVGWLAGIGLSWLVRPPKRR